MEKLDLPKALIFSSARGGLRGTLKRSQNGNEASGAPRTSSRKHAKHEFFA